MAVETLRCPSGALTDQHIQIASEIWKVSLLALGTKFANRSRKQAHGHNPCPHPYPWPPVT